MLGCFGSPAQVGARVRSFHDFGGDREIKDVLTGLDSREEMLVAGIDEGNGGMGFGSGLHFAGDNDKLKIRCCFSWP